MGIYNDLKIKKIISNIASYNHVNRFNAVQVGQGIRYQVGQRQGCKDLSRQKGYHMQKDVT